MMAELISDDSGDLENADITAKISAYLTLQFDNTAASTWAVEDYRRYTLTHDTVNDVLVIRSKNGDQWWFHDFRSQPRHSAG